MMRCSVVGAGAWGTAIANLLSGNGHNIMLWARESDVVSSINTRHENVRFLKGHALHEELRASASLGEVLSGRELVVFATPAQAFREVARRSVGSLAPAALVVLASKGIEENTLALMSDVAAAELPGHPLVVISGPNFAHEVASGCPTASVVASLSPEAARTAQTTFNGKTFRTYTHSDVIGVEVGGALKNVIAVASGVSDGLGLGNNARAALVTRGLAEMSRLGIALGADAATFAGLAGIGDLVVTSMGSLSRNRSVGFEIAKGKTLDEILRERETVAEGVVTTRSARALARREGVEMPIVDAVYRVLFDGESPRDVIAELMARAPRAEGD
jgi:glycerol-3-phosphate dehydrogenase (NAD(P)+)